MDRGENPRNICRSSMSKNIYRTLSDDYKVGIYVRESRDDKEENYDTIETQRDLLIDYVNSNKIGTVVKIYIDDNVSGSGFERRGLDELKEDVIGGRINLLVIKDLSRLGRNNAKTLLFLDFLEEYKVRTITFDGRYDSLKDSETVGIDTWYNERYIRDISKKIRANIRYKIEKGEYLGNAPYGYLKSEKEKNTLVINREEEEVIKKIYELYKEGYGYSSISQHLNKRGYVSPKGSLWNSIAVRRILTNRVYVGDTVQGVSEKISFKSKKTRRISEENWIITENTHEGIISREEFAIVQDIREKRRICKTQHKGEIHLFRGIIYCGRCSSVLFARKRKNKPMGYICSNYCKNGKDYCESHYLNEAALFNIVIGDIKLLLDRDIDISKKIMEAISVKDMDKKIEIMKKQLEVKKRQQELLYIDRLEGKITESLFLRMNLLIENKIENIKNDVKKLENKRVTMDKSNNIMWSIKENIEDRITNEILKDIINRIIVFRKDDQYIEETWKLKLTSKEIENIQKYGGVVIEYNYK